VLYTITGDTTGTNAGVYTATVILNDTENYVWEDGTADDLTIKWSIAKADPSYTLPSGLTAAVGQKLSAVSLAAHTGWAWASPNDLVGAEGTQKHKANFTPTDAVNYNALTDIDVSIKVSADGGGADPIRNDVKKTGKYGIAILPNSIVSDKAEILIALPDNDNVVSAKIVIYDNVGNVVYEAAAGRDGKADWNLTNLAGRDVANGGYLIIAEVKGISGKVYAYSAKVGVRR
jgi:hypothetical protein